jgi:pimeloyl-ACP methyl ester carboxylesterase
MTELVKIRSDQWQISGVIHAPLDTAQRRRVGVVLLHENFNTKFGTHRMFYQVGEALAAAGFYALRYDNRGMCDSLGTNPLSFPDRIADAAAATHFFRKKLDLEAVLFWGLCMGGAVALHTGAQLGPGQPDGMMLCSLLADPGDASLPEFGFEYQPVMRGNFWKRASRFLSDGTYRKNVSRLVKGMITRAVAREPELEHLKRKIGEVGRLLQTYAGPVVLVFGDNDPCWDHFNQRVNANDKLGLLKMAPRRTFLMVEGGDHTFSSIVQTNQVIEYTVEWAEAFRDRRAEQFTKLISGEKRDIPVASIAE